MPTFPNSNSPIPSRLKSSHFSAYSFALASCFVITGALSKRQAAAGISLNASERKRLMWLIRLNSRISASRRSFSSAAHLQSVGWRSIPLKRCFSAKYASFGVWHLPQYFSPSSGLIYSSGAVFAASAVSMTADKIGSIFIGNLLYRCIRNRSSYRASACYPRQAIFG